MADDNGSDRTTIVETGGGSGGGLLAVVLLIILAIGLFLYFGGYVGGPSKTEIKVPDKIDVNVNQK